MKQIHSEHAVLKVVAEDIGVVAFDRGDALFFLELLDRGNQIAIFGSSFVLLIFGSFRHALAKRPGEVGWTPFEEHLHVANRFLINLRCC